MKSRLALLLLPCLVATSTGAVAAEFLFKPKSTGAVQLALIGEIKPGDSEKLTRLIRDQPREFIGASSISLSSKGGSIIEAIKVADIVEKSGLIATVESGDVCASACFLVLVSAQFRWLSDDAAVLIHRPFLPDVKTDVEGYSNDLKAQQKATAAMRGFLEERSVSSALIDKMMNYPSNNAHRLTAQEMDKDVKHLSPTLEELTIRRCGLSNQNIFNSDRNFGDDPEKDDLSCIRHFLISIKFDYAESIIGEERFDKVLETL